ncbi:hypothetical protein ACJMK2_038126 [Sinanodonta woodiana]|uniref:Uncharacterized protein n=1 Tax=Sinanodonta woodiana TaxID=1069815 RepID=A0ABD3WMJ9_SINWO
MVWLKDVTASLQTNKREFSDADLPNHLAFRLRVGSRALTLNLKRNRAIDPNADVYFVSEVNDGRSLLEQAHILKEEEVAYYQDKRNGAFMTVKCLRGSNGGCVRVINGNLQVEDINYDLQPAKIFITSRDLFDVPDLGTRYVLRAQINLQSEISVTREDTTIDKVKHVFNGLLQRSPNDQEHVPFSNFTFVSRQGSSIHARDNAKDVYYIETAVLLDSTIWDL